MDFELFHEQCKSLPERERAHAEVFYKTLTKVFDDDEPNFRAMNRVCELFYGKTESVSKALFYRRKRYVKMFYAWLFQQGLVGELTLKQVDELQMQDVLNDHEIAHYYFKNLDDVISFISLVGGRYGLGDTDDMLVFKTIAILSWYGLDTTELLSVKKTDLNRSNNTITLIGNVIEIDPTHMEIIVRFSDLDFHKGFPSHKPQIYKDSEFLIRSGRQNRLSLDNLRHTLLRFNTIARDYGKELSALKLKRNGVFYKVYNSKDEKSVNAIIREIEGCDRAFAVGYKDLYERWKMLKDGEI